MEFTIAQAVRKLLIKEPFYGLFLMSIDKRYDSKVETACVARKGISVELLINKDFWDSLTESQCVGLLEHEAGHILRKHLTDIWQDFDNQEMLNIAQDIEINSYIADLPEGGWKAEFVGLPPAMGSKFYYDKLKQLQKQKGNSGIGSGTNGKRDENGTPMPLDSHDWGDFKDLPEAEKQLIENQIDHLAKQTAEQVQKLNGHIPAQFQSYIADLFKIKERIFNWKSYFRRMLGTMKDVELKKTRKRESKRFPGASGQKHLKKSNICVIVDTSGSVSDKELCDFFSEIYHVWRSGSCVTIIENDATIQRIYKYNGKWDLKCSGRGGTVFNDAVTYYNDHRHEFNSVIFFTDGYADVDLNIMGDSVWVITSNGCKQNYPGKTIYIPKDNAK